MNDRLNDLKRYNPNVSVVETSDDDITSIDEEKEDNTEQEMENVDYLQEEMNNLMEMCNRIEFDIDLIKNYSNEFFSNSTNIKKDPRIDAISREIMSYSNIIRNRIKQLKTAPDDEYNAENRMKQNIESVITKRFIDLMQKYQRLKTDYHARHEEHTKRCTEIMNGDDTQVIQLSMIDGDRQKDKSTLAIMHIKEQHKEIIELEQEIVELYQLFVDMANIVDTQDETVNNIVKNIEKSEAWIGDAVHNQLPKARKYKTQQRKKCCALCGSCIALAGTAAAGIALGLAPLAACSIQ